MTTHYSVFRNYKSLRAFIMCGRSPRDKGRPLTSYLRGRIEKDDTCKVFGAWCGDVATYYPDDRVKLDSGAHRLSNNALWQCFTIRRQLHRERYVLLTRYANTPRLAPLFEEGVVLDKDRRVIASRPQALRRVEPEASKQWASDYRATRKLFRTMAKLGAFNHLVLNDSWRGNSVKELERHLGRSISAMSELNHTEVLIQAVRARDAHLFGTLCATMVGRCASVQDFMTEADRYYVRQRQSIHYAVGARTSIPQEWVSVPLNPENSAGA